MKIKVNCKKKYIEDKKGQKLAEGDFFIGHPERALNIEESILEVYKIERIHMIGTKPITADVTIYNRKTMETETPFKKTDRVINNCFLSGTHATIVIPGKDFTICE